MIHLCPHIFVCLLVCIPVIEEEGVGNRREWPDPELTVAVSAGTAKQIIKCLWKKSWGCLWQLGTLQFQIKAGS